MAPQIRCPQCGMSINLENREKIDMNLIMRALQTKRRLFTKLLTITKLSRKTLSLRLKELVSTGAIVKDGGYALNGFLSLAQSFGNYAGIPNEDLKKTLVHLRKNIVVLFLLLCIGMPVAFHVYAHLTSSPEPIPPVATFTVSPKPPYFIRWVQQSNGETTYYYPTLVFTATTDENGRITTYLWNLGDGSTANTESVTHIYKKPGTYNVTLTVINDMGLNATAWEVITIEAVETTLYIEPRTAELTVGETFTVTLFVSNVEDFWGWQTRLIFNPEVLECISFEKTGAFNTREPLVEGHDEAYIIKEGLFPRTSGTTLWMTPVTIDNSAGIVGLSGCCFWVSDSGMLSIDGSGSLAVATFKVRGFGTSPLELIDVFLLSSEGEEIPINIVHGCFNVP